MTEVLESAKINAIGRQNLINWLGDILRDGADCPRYADGLINDLDCGDPHRSLIVEVRELHARDHHPHTYTFGADEFEIEAVEE